MTSPAETIYGFCRSDIEALADELAALRRRIRRERGRGIEDFEQLKKLERWGRMCTGLGYGTSWIAPNLVSAALLAMGKMTRWTALQHPIAHRGYDTVPGIPERYTSKGFARGWRRYVDWFDWMTPDGWHQEHNVLHHFRLGEDSDPDLVEANLSYLRDSPLPMPLRYAATLLMAATWKFSYYAPTTLTETQVLRARAEGRPTTLRVATWELFDPRTERGRELWLTCYLPYAGYHFVLLPLLALPLGPWAATSVLINSMMAEVLHNIHSFVVITPNHSGDDVTRYDSKPRGRAEFFLHQILGSVNYPTGGDVNDWLHGWLNYQIEHHLFPNLSLREYQRIQPQVKALCEKYGVPYRQESVWRRARKSLDVMVGKADMRRSGP